MLLIRQNITTDS